MVVIPIMSYAAVIWWPRVKYKTIQAKLSNLQGLTCLAVTGAIRMAPTTAVEVLLGLPPLYLKVQTEAWPGIYRLNCNEQWKPKPLWYVHISIYIST